MRQRALRTISSLLLRIVAVLLANVPTLLFVAGFVWLYVGVAGWSAPAANVVGGVVLMALASVPYLRARRES
jgi:hypothetical protein